MIYYNSLFFIGYFKEGFLAVQHFMTLSLVLAKQNFSYPKTSNFTLIKWLLDNKTPFINMRRFAYAEWQEDVLLTALKSMIGLIIMLSFVYTCINTVRAITTEKEKQLKVGEYEDNVTNTYKKLNIS